MTGTKERSNIIKFDQETAVSVPSAKSEARLGIRRADWRRVKQRIQAFEKGLPRLSIVYSILFGVAGTAGLSIIALVGAEGLPSWVLIVYACVCAATLVGGIICLWCDRKFRSEEKQESINILTEMDEIEDAFGEEERE
jgi:hypothetical protein